MSPSIWDFGFAALHEIFPIWGIVFLADPVLDSGATIDDVVR